MEQMFHQATKGVSPGCVYMTALYLQRVKDTGDHSVNHAVMEFYSEFEMVFVNKGLKYGSHISDC